MASKMALLLENDFSGQTDGIAVTALNSGDSGSAFSHVLPGTGGSINYVAEASDRGVAFAGTSPSARWTLVDSQGPALTTRRSFDYTGGVLPAARMLATHHTSPFTNGTSSTQVCFVQQRSGFDQIELGLGSGVALTASRLDMTAEPAGRYWVEMVSVASSAEGASDGVLGLRVYKPDGVTLVDPGAQQEFTGLDVTYVHPGSVRWSLCNTVNAGIASDRMFAPRALFTDALTWLGPMGSAVQLDTPSLSLTGSVPASSISATDGEKTVSWVPVPNALSYEAYKASHGSTDYVLVQAGVTSPYTFDGLPAGAIRLAIKAKA